MKTKNTIVGGFIALILGVVVLPVTATPAVSPLKVVAKAAIVVNGSPTKTTIPTLPAKVTVADVGLTGIVHLGTGLQFEFQDSGGNPVDVTNLKIARADHSLVGSGVQYWTNTSLGSFHPDDQGSPDYHVYNASSVDVTPSSGFVTGYLGDNSGAVIPVASKFQVTDQTIVLGGTSGHPLLVAAGNYYSFTYNLTFSYDYAGGTYTKTFLPSETEAMVLVTNGLPEFVLGDGELPVPCVIQLRVSDDLVNWVIPPGVVIPNPRPTQVLNIIALFPKSSAFPGQITAEYRFFQYFQTPMP